MHFFQKRKIGFLMTFCFTVCNCQNFGKKDELKLEFNTDFTDSFKCLHTDSLECECPVGFRISQDKKFCEDINECLLGNGHGPCQDICKNTFGSYKCDCRNGTVVSEDQHSCKNVDKCIEGKSGCSHNCINTNGSVFCTCPAGMILSSNEKTCQDIDECEDVEVKKICIFGCVNTIGSYFCIKNTEPSESLSDEDYDEGDYESEDDYEESEEDDDYENNDDKDSERGSKPSKTDKILIDTNQFKTEVPNNNTNDKSKVNEEKSKEDNENSKPKEYNNNKENDYKEYDEDYKDNSNVDDNNTKDTGINEHFSSTTTVTNVNIIENKTEETIKQDKSYDHQAKIEKEETKNDTNRTEKTSVTEVKQEDFVNFTKTEGNKIENKVKDDYSGEAEENKEDYEFSDNKNSGHGTLSNENKSVANEVNVSLVNSLRVGENEDFNNTYIYLSENSIDLNRTLLKNNSLIEETGENRNFNRSDIFDDEDYDEEDEEKISTVKEEEITTRISTEFTNSPSIVTNNAKKDNKFEETINSIEYPKVTNITESSSETLLDKKNNIYLTNHEEYDYNQKYDEKKSTTHKENEVIKNEDNNVYLITESPKITNVFTIQNEVTITTEKIENNSSPKTENKEYEEEYYDEDYEEAKNETSCSIGFRLNEGECIDINECELNEHDCSHTCQNTIGSYLCTCPKGFQLKNSYACEDINECLVNPCSHICINTIGDFQCSCPPGFVSNVTGTCEDVNECLVNHGNCSQICVNFDGSFVCECNEGFVLNPDNATCNEIDPCLKNNGNCSHICKNLDGKAVCECPEGLWQNDSNCVNPCMINNGGCSHFCDFVNDRISCLCPELHNLVNGTQCIEDNPCLNSNGGCSHICEFRSHSVICSCPETHSLLNETHCAEINPCMIDNGGCSHSCEFSKGEMQCSCPLTYYLEGKNCYKTDPCLSENGGCSHYCLSNDRGNVMCSCPTDYDLDTNNKTCLIKDLCGFNNGNCSHFCTVKYRKIICSCPDGYVLKKSKTCLKYDPCQDENGGCSHFCNSNNGTAKCSCPENHFLKDDWNCEFDPCQVNNGGCSDICQSENGKIICSCPKNFELFDNKCVEVNPCFIDNGGCSHECAVIDRKAHCLCPEGYQLDHKKCILKNPCSVDNGGCSHICDNINGYPVCSCPVGYQLLARNGTICFEKILCARNNGGCSHFCETIEGRISCSCPVGFILRPNQKICKQINPCEINKGGCSHGCRHLSGRTECTCPQGFRLSPTNNKLCVEVDNCSINNGNCQMHCRNVKGGHKCSCDEGFVLADDKHSCILTTFPDCPLEKAPIFGKIRCYHEGSSFVPLGTKCQVWCNEGYKLIGNPIRTCKNSGDWNYPAPFCRASSCSKLMSITNGWLVPNNCNNGHVYSGESCKIVCKTGFKVRNGDNVLQCNKNLTWNPTKTEKDISNICVKDIPYPYIKCPGNGKINFILPLGQAYMHIKVPRPETNMEWFEHVNSQPSWGMKLETTLPAGRTEVVFNIHKSISNSSFSSCHLVINILDMESPKVYNCPTNMEYSLNRKTSQLVYWTEPKFEDNVGVVSIYKSREPGTNFGTGLHHINYVANDEAGNRAFCHFTIEIKDDLITSLMHLNQMKERPRKYRAILICPTGIQYDNQITNKAGCYWRHVRVNNEIEAHSYRIPPHKIHSGSNLPLHIRTEKRRYFDWYEKCC